jgi:hypothetical protein
MESTGGNFFFPVAFVVGKIVFLGSEICLS